jgi:hypothetical protein
VCTFDERGDLISGQRSVKMSKTASEAGLMLRSLSSVLLPDREISSVEVKTGPQACSRLRAGGSTGSA